MVIKNLMRRKLRTTFSVLGVGVGISLMVALFTMTSDFENQLRDILSSSRGDIYAIEVGQEIFSSRAELEIDGKDMVAEIADDPNVVNAQPFIYAWLKTDTQLGPASRLDYYGVTSNSPVMKHFEVVEHFKPGEPLIDDADPNGVVVGVKLLELINAMLTEDKKLEVGKSVKLRDLLVGELSQIFGANPETWATKSKLERDRFVTDSLANSGVKPMAALGMNELYLRAVITAPQAIMEAGIYFPLEQAQRLRGMEGQATAILIELDDKSSDAKDETRERLARSFDQYNFSRSDALLDQYPEFKLLQKFNWGVSVVAGLAGALGVLNIMLLAVHERTREIGLLLAIGWGRPKVLRAIIYEGTMITLLGGIVGVLLGYLIQLFNYHVLDIVVLEPKIDPKMSVYALGLAMVLGVLASIYPAWRASRLTPMDAIRQE